MKATLVCKPHFRLPNANVFEVHFDGKLICTITGADGPGIRVISKHQIRDLQKQPSRPPIPGCLEITFDT